ncbi:hypothetical protein T4B_9637 [Trichinella pseudospiralis]|uniref:Uncharacterized protein n=1 Tax=Trichinella pseudospiralis TaxID=6337 RepID=A0A0V1IB40_TRIPS|nr:hypothetical protein T4B_9637 [Trichinella pseudospiralis]KRZ26433.1 hypothetical protein T4C_2256 [Trichinella pseudospiralis]
MISAKNEAIDVLKLRILSFMHMHCLNTNMPLLRIGVFNYASIFKKLFMLRFVYEEFESMSLPPIKLKAFSACLHPQLCKATEPIKR